LPIKDVAYTDSLYLPLALRALITLCPALVDILFRKPLPFLTFAIEPRNVLFIPADTPSRLLFKNYCLIEFLSYAIISNNDFAPVRLRAWLKNLRNQDKTLAFR
jgi:hypothetical protein